MALGFLVLLQGCAARIGPGAAERRPEPSRALLEWLAGHEPSRLDVSGFALEAIRHADPAAAMRIAPEEPRAACLQAARNRALLLIYAPVAQRTRRSAALDCGFALWRDDRAVIIAPR